MLKIGDLRERTRVNVSTLRYYENLGLLKPALRSDTGYRYFNDSVVQRVLFIKKAQTLNFSLAEIQEILHSHDRGTAVCSIVKDLIERKISHLDTEIQKLLAAKQRLKSHRERWTTYSEDPPNSESICTLVEELISLETSISH
ncbi:MerR family transcriptional regulator [Chamaesiphon polymorphus]|uniref:Heavy metal-responsive transcriptional regulator n=1 Tax=Chamaesiphon polymorphus CCALA 037 TaxID=2107692 RepID=A0A2T1GNV4_9CYAN|nr:MerR family transcriptional regulator [Chamaesiphon polymorphus]PSB59635.1 heavy metal-responsive transcriptional regulator [Chamaesiphon polymorphus CCALA 037]